jgi:hypothetical protein
MEEGGKDTFQSGALIDTRPESERIKDYKFNEVVASANPVTWVEKTQAQWRHFPIFNQDGSGSCVAQTMAKLMGVLYWLKNNVYVHFSATHIYQRRVNRPQGGMGGVDVFDVARKGVTLEELVPSQGMDDSQMDGVNIPQYKQDVGAIFKIGNYLIVQEGDIETVASIIETTKKAVMVWFYFKSEEWTPNPKVIYPDLDRYAQSTARHSVAAVDYALVGGKKSLIIDDSWGTSYGLAGERVIDEDFYRARNFFAAYPMSFQFEDQSQPQPTPVITKPKYTFTVPLVFDSTSADVKALQDILRYEGFFPVNADSTGYYGSVTAKGVLSWQKKYSIASTAELESLAGRRVGVKTVKKLNELYSA